MHSIINNESMKRLFTVIIAVSFFGIKAFSQDEIAPRNQKDSVVPLSTSHVKKKKELKLSKEQKQQVKKFKQSAKAKKSAIKNNSALTEDQKKIKLKQVHKENRKKLEAILTPEQKEEMKKRKDTEPHRGVTNMPNERKAK